MKPDLTNILTVPMEDAGMRHVVVVRHRMFPEIQVERESMVDGLKSLLLALQRSREWTADEWRRLALGDAIVEVETALTLVAPSGYSRMVHEEYTITRLNDLVYIFDRTSVPGASVATAQDGFQPEFPQGFAALVQIFAGGRHA